MGNIDPVYVLDHEQTEIQRLEMQASMYRDATTRMLGDAGVAEGMTVLDVGCGAGDVSMIVAKLVGPAGRVFAVDRDERAIARSRARAEHAGLTNITFIQADWREVELPCPVDAVVGRLVLMYQNDPVGALRSVAAKLKPGGLIAFIELDRLNHMRVHPHSETMDKIGEWIWETFGRAGIDTSMGGRLHEVFTQAGFPPPRMYGHAPMGGDPSWLGFEFLAETVRSLIPFATHFGVATAEDIQVDSLAARLREEVTAQNGIVTLPTHIAAWSRKAA